MDRTTVFTKTAKGLMEATGKTSHLSRDIRAVLKEVDGRATVELLQTRLSKLSEAKLQEALETLMRDDFVREFSTAPSSVAPTIARSAPPPSRAPVASGDEDLDFTSAIPSAPAVDKRAEEAARQKAQAAAAAARAKAAAEAAARAKAEAEAKAKAQAAARAKAEAEARAKAEAAARAKAEAEARAKREAEERARKEAEDRARREAEEKARREAEELRAKLEEERRAREEAERKAKEEAERERRAAEEKARREADELRAKLEEERKAREEAERKVREQAERERREAEEKARREADELRAKLEEERKAREEAERKAKEEAERERRAAEEKARREADELRAKLEEERKAREEAERKAKEEAERRAREDAERRAREEAERVRLETEEKARREAEEQALRQAEERAKAEEQARIDAEARARRESEDAQRAREEAEREAREQAERERRQAEDRTRREAEETAAREAEEQARKQTEARRQAEEKARIETEEAERRAREEAERQAREQAERERREAEDRTRRETEEKAERERRETEEKAAQQPPAPAGSALDDLVKIETDFDAVLKASAGAPQEAAKRAAGPDDQLQKAADELERRQAEEQARAAEEKARAQAKAEAEAKAKQAGEEESREGEGQERHKAAPLGVEEHLSSHAEAQALLDEQNAETERHFADMEKELEAEQAAAPVPKKAPEPQEPAPARTKKEAKESARAAAKEAKESARAAAAAAAAQARETEAEYEIEPVPASYRPRINWGKPVALGLFLLIVLGLVAVNFISFDGSIPQFEKAAGAYLQQPVKIKALHLSLVPQPHWRLDEVSVGNEGQLKVARVNAVAELGSMFSDKKAFSSIELESPVLGEQGFLSLLFGKPAGRDFKVANIVAKNAKLESKTFILPALDAKIAMGADGAWQKIALETPDHKTSLTLKPDGDGAALEVETNAFSLPFHPAFILENFVASGQIGRGELRLNEFKGGIFDGYLAGNAKLKWGADWSLDGAISVRAMDPGKFVPALLDQGRLEGKAAYSMRAKSYDELFEAPRLEGTFDILKGNLLGVDLGRMLQGGGAGGKTAYAELSGSFVREAGRIQLRQLNLVSGPVSAGGSAEVDAGKRINGRFAVELKSPVAHARANLTLSGTLQEPHFSR